MAFPILPIFNYPDYLRFSQLKKGVDMNDSDIPLIEIKMRVKVQTSKNLIFFTFHCPHCGVENTLAKEFKAESLLCSRLGCRKMIIIGNYEMIA